jgi:hypothetical protein
VSSRASERGVALVFALATLTLVAITIGAVASEIQSRGAGVVIEERSVRLAALSDAAMAETLAELADRGAAFGGIPVRAVAGGSIASSVRPLGEWEVEVKATGRRDGWQSVITAQVRIQGVPRVVWWQRTQSPIPLQSLEPFNVAR